MHPVTQLPNHPITPITQLPHVRIFKLAAVLMLWALSFILNEVALRTVQPATVVAGRWSVTAVLVLLLLARRGQMGAFTAALRVDWRAFFLLSLFGVTLLYGLQISGQARTSAVNTGLLANIVPVFTALLATTFLHQRLRRPAGLGIVLALMGAWVVSTGGLRLEVNRANGAWAICWCLHLPWPRRCTSCSAAGCCAAIRRCS